MPSDLPLSLSDFSFYLGRVPAVLRDREGPEPHPPRGFVDPQIVEDARRGHSRAQEVLVRAITPRLLALASRLGCDPQLSEEIVADALYRGMIKLKQVKDPHTTDSWFCRILVNAWRDHLRRERRQPLSMEIVEEPPAAPGPSPEERAQADELKDEVRAAIASLPPGQRAAVALHMEEGFTLSEIAAVLGTTSDRVKANLWHGRRRLRERLRHRFEKKPDPADAADK